MVRWPERSWVPCALAALLAGLPAGLPVGLGAGEAAAFDAEALRVRLIPRDAPDGAPVERLAVTEGYWMTEEAILAEHRHDALRVTQDYVSDNLATWVRGGALESVEQLRHTDISVAGGSGPGEDDLGVKLRLAEKVRLSVSRESFRRDLMYDPIRRRMWVDLYHMDLPDVQTGVTLSNIYGFGDEGNRLMLNLRHRFD